MTTIAYMHRQSCLTILLFTLLPAQRNVLGYQLSTPEIDELLKSENDGHEGNRQLSPRTTSKVAMVVCVITVAVWRDRDWATPVLTMSLQWLYPSVTACAGGQALGVSGGTFARRRER